MKAKKYNAIIIIIFLSLTSINMLCYSFFIDRLDELANDQEIDENIYDKLKLSFAQNWNTSWDSGNNDFGRSIAIEESTGDIYVTGYNESVEADVVLVKYDNNGKELWNVTYDYGDNEYGYDVAIDSWGNVYVAGANGTFYPNWDVLLLKFNRFGDLEWTRSWDGGSYDGAWALEIDADDNIYIAGTTITTSNDILLLKYNSTGHYKWNSTINAPDNQYAYDLVLDSMNNIYIAGVNETASHDLLTAKFDSAGTQIWNRTWGQYEYLDQGHGIALDSKNNVIVTGYTQSYGAIGNDIITIKYDNNGNWKWNRTWGTIGTDEAWSVAIDSADNIYTCLYTVFCNVSILKYSAFGDLIWDKTFANNSIYKYWWYDIEIDSLDKIYITGYNRTGSLGIYDFFTAKFSIESPAGFKLTADCGVPDTDGIFTLNWSAASRANNYSIYQYSSYITKINGSLISKVSEIDALSLPISGYSNGTYYFKAVAFNNYGNSTSNCINVTVAISPPSPPGSFTLSSNAGTPDTDGNFNLTWASSSGANNYSIYQHFSFISNINDTITLIAEQNATSPYPISGYSNGTYYFKAVAFNDFGNNTSNCINVTVAISPPSPPGSFTLSSNAGTPDNDGNFNLTWASSSGANNYSIYQHYSFISNINDTITLIAEQNATSPYLISGYSNGTYYFKAVAFNNYGNSTSNCINITVAIPPSEPTEPPGSFTLSSNAGIPDTDGNFTLTWTSSSRANNYSIYQFSSFITEINNSVTLLEEEIDVLSLPLTGYGNGSYYFIVVAFNNFGNSTSNNINVNVEIPPEEPEDGGTEPDILGYNTMFLICAIIGITSILIYRRLKLK